MLSTQERPDRVSASHQAAGIEIRVTIARMIHPQREESPQESSAIQSQIARRRARAPVPARAHRQNQEDKNTPSIATGKANRAGRGGEKRLMNLDLDPENTQDAK